tara:strand:+ start:109 stop:1143 length:1035 start_codon:yes stop_codon:yes gene_type:complete
MSNILIIGAGLFGCCTAIELERSGHRVTLLEKESDIMKKASKMNHNRIHLGFHYPRSIKTAKQSLNGLVSFLLNFKEAIVSDFPNYYMNHIDSNVSSTEYTNFCDEVGISYEFEYPKNYLLKKKDIDLSLRVNEPIFDYDILKSIVDVKLKDVNLKLNTEFDGDITGYDYIINASYSNVNIVNDMLESPKLNLKFQDVIVPIFKMKHKPIGLTIMDGPFCSVMPKGANDNEFLLYHPKFSVVSDSKKHISLSEENENDLIDAIYKNSIQYYPFLKNVERQDCWRTVRALPVNHNDARLSEIFINKKNQNHITILSGKISTCWKVAYEIKSIIRNKVKLEEEIVV